MTDTDIRIALARAMGWRDFRRDLHDPNLLLGSKAYGAMGLEEFEVPRLTLDWMHEVEKTLPDDQWELYESYMWDTSKTIAENGRRLVSASVAARAEAFLKTIGKWEGA